MGFALGTPSAKGVYLTAYPLACPNTDTAFVLNMTLLVQNRIVIVLNMTVMVLDMTIYFFKYVVFVLNTMKLALNEFIYILCRKTTRF